MKQASKSESLVACNYLILKNLVGERGFEPPTPWSRTWGRGADFVNSQSFEWCFNRLSLTRSRQSWPNVNPSIATLARVSTRIRPDLCPATRRAWQVLQGRGRTWKSSVVGLRGVVQSG